MIQAADGITAAQRINRMDFWPDFLTVASLFSIFWALTISVIVSVAPFLEADPYFAMPNVSGGKR
jgi:hypothetical protein